MKKIVLSVLATAVSIILTGCNILTENKTEGQRPNILILLADDLGYGELGCYGQQMISTPFLDELAANGILFTDFYSGSAVCSPSRAVLMTGKSSSFSTVRGNIGYFDNTDSYGRVALKKEELTLGEMMRDAGYQTAYIGKWHLDNPADLETWAFNRGFDFAIQEQWGNDERGIPYDEEMHWINGKEDSIYYYQDEYDCKDQFRTNLAIEYLDSIDMTKPFFLFMSFRAPHAHEKYIRNKELYSDHGWPEKERMHAAKITLLDRQIGRLVDKLEEINQIDNTLIFFTSDNGPHGELGHDYEFFNSNSSLKGFKRELYEGGIRVPALAYWKGKIEPGTTSGFLGCGQDLMPTLAEAAGIKIPEQTNGVSIIPVLLGYTPDDREFLNWEFQKYGTDENNFRQAVRIGNMKGIRYGSNSETQLFDLGEDIEESTNISDFHQEMVRKIENIFFEERANNVHFPYGGYKK